jgi:hypothetical protein
LTKRRNHALLTRLRDPSEGGGIILEWGGGIKSEYGGGIIGIRTDELLDAWVRMLHVMGSEAARWLSAAAAYPQCPISADR